MTNPAAARRPGSWAVVLALASLYLSWGTTNLAIKVGVQTLPTCLFGGVRVFSAGLILFAYLALRGERLRLDSRDLLRLGLGGLCLFVMGNGLLTEGARTIPSGLASVLGATAPLWLALLEALWPWGERLTGRGWLGLFTGLAGLLVILAPSLQRFEGFWNDRGTGLVLISSFMWGLGSFLLRRRSSSGSPSTAAAYQMLIGGGALTLIGLSLGEARQITAESLTPQAIVAFFYLLVVGSLIGFIAFTWLMSRVPTPLASTYAYVNPLVAILVGWQLGNEELSAWLVAGMVIILVGVGLVRTGGVRLPRTPADLDGPARQPATPRQPAICISPAAD
jgi:drug/metabolite transporter (DMT)-like permease